MQQTLSENGFEKFRKKTRKEQFPEEMEILYPPERNGPKQSSPFIPHPKGAGRPPIGIERMLRIHFLPHWFNLSDPTAEETLYASRGSGNAGVNKEKTVRQWFVDHDLIESVLYLPENLFYNTTAPGIVLFLNRAKPKARQGKVFLVNASQVFEKGDPKNFIPPESIQRIADTLTGWEEEDKLSRIVNHAELAKNDYNISPSRYIHTSDAETYRPIAEIVEELKVIEGEARETDKALKTILKGLGAAS